MGNACSRKADPSLTLYGMDAILDVITACPSGALRVSVGDQPPQHVTTGHVAIAVEANGPYHVTHVALAAEFNSVGTSRAKYLLCRCGLSKNKLFCDGTHHDAAWSDDGTVAPDLERLFLRSQCLFFHRTGGFRTFAANTSQQIQSVDFRLSELTFRRTSEHASFCTAECTWRYG